MIASAPLAFFLVREDTTAALYGEVKIAAGRKKPSAGIALTKAKA
jgi:hypothetical protein